MIMKHILMPLFTVTLAGLPIDRQASAAPQEDEKSSQHLEVGDVTAEQQEDFKTYLKRNQQPAVDFVVGRFKTCDVVLLGEDHKVAENCRFVASLIEPLYNAGVRTLLWEFTRSAFNADIERLVTGKKFDDELANRLLREGPWSVWGYREYVDILRGAWRLNGSLPSDAPRFRVIAIDSDWSQYELWFGDMDRVQQFKTIAAREKHMTAVTESESLEKGEKALLHIGYAHTLTNSGERLGTVLHGKYGDRVEQVTLHRAWGRADGKAPLGDLLDRLFKEAGGKAVGLEVAGSPLGPLRDSSAGAFRFNKTASFGDLTGNYVFLGEHRSLHRVSWIDGFITEDRFKQARAIAERMQWISADEGKSPQDLDAAMRRKFDGERFK